jgi:hypothetical protein
MGECGSYFDRITFHKMIYFQQIVPSAKSPQGVFLIINVFNFILKIKYRDNLVHVMR